MGAARHCRLVPFVGGYELWWSVSSCLLFGFHATVHNMAPGFLVREISGGGQ